MFMIATTVFGLGAIASILLTIRGIAEQSWIMMWMAALASLAASIATIFSIGALVFLFTSLQIGAAVALRRNASSHGWLAALLLGLMVWSVIIPLQILVADRLPPNSEFVLLLIAVLWLLVPLLPVGRARSETS